MSNIPCEIPCDYCEAKPAHWFGQTSVAICGKTECYDKCQAAWEELVRQSELERQVEEEWS